jgi:hypothetical protein
VAVNALGFSTGATPSTTVSVPVPSGVAVGDLLLIWVVSQVAGMTFSDTGDGFTAVTAATGQNCSAQLLYRTATSADVSLSSSSGDYTVTASVSHSIAGIVVDLPGASFDPSTPTSSGQLLSTAGTSIPATGVTTDNAGDLLLWFGGIRNPTGTVPTIGVPSGFTTQVSQTNSSTSGANVGAIFAYETQATAGATGTQSGSLSEADDGGALLIAVSQSASFTGAAALSGSGTMQGTIQLPLTVRVRHVGAALGDGSSNSGSTGYPDLTRAEFDEIVIGCGTLHVFFQDTIPASLSAAPQSLASYAGVCRVWVDFEPTHYGIDGVYNDGGTPASGAVTDLANMSAFIESCQAGNLDLRIVLWHEVWSKFNVYGTQADNNQDLCNSLGYYGAMLRSYGLPVVLCVANYTANSSYGHWASAVGDAAAPGLGWAVCSLGYIDEVYTDIYTDEAGTIGGAQGTFDNMATLASAFSLPLGILELGPIPASNPDPGYNAADTNTFLSYVIDYLSAWVADPTVVANGVSIPTTPLADIVFWATADNGGYTQSMPQNWSTQTVTNYDTLYDTYNGGVYGSGAINPFSGLNGSGSITANGLVGGQGSSALSGSGSITATGSPGGSGGGASALSGSGSMTSMFGMTIPRSVTLSGSGSLTTLAAVKYPGASALGGIGSIGGYISGTWQATVKAYFLYEGSWV